MARMITTLGAIAIAATSATAIAQDKKQASRTGKPVTQANYCRAETDRSFSNGAKRGVPINQFEHYRALTPLDKQSVIRMNKDVLYSAALVDTSKGATLTVPKMPDGRYFSVLMIDNDHYTPGTIYTSGTHKLPQRTKYLTLLLRIHLLDPDDPKDIAIANRLQDQFVIKANSADPFPPFAWDMASLEAATARYNEEFKKFDRYPDEWMGPRGVANDKTRHLACAGGWGLFPNKDALYINYSGKHAPGKCYRATYAVPENKAFWSLTVYGADGYLKSANSVLNKSNVKFNPDGTFTVGFGEKATCGDVPNRLDAPEGWNLLMRVYRPGPSVLNGSYKLPTPTAVN